MAAPDAHENERKIIRAKKKCGWVRDDDMKFVCWGAKIIQFCFPACFEQFLRVEQE